MHVPQFVDLVPPDVNPARRQVCRRWPWSYPVLPTGAANSMALRNRVPTPEHEDGRRGPPVRRRGISPANLASQKAYRNPALWTIFASNWDWSYMAQADSGEGALKHILIQQDLPLELVRSSADPGVSGSAGWARRAV